MQKTAKERKPAEQKRCTLGYTRAGLFWPRHPFSTGMRADLTSLPKCTVLITYNTSYLPTLSQEAKVLTKTCLAHEK